LQPPQPAPVWNHTPESLKAEVNAVITAARTTHDKVAALPKPERTFTNVFGALAEAEAAIDSRGELLGFYQHVSQDSALRDASADVEVALKEFGIEREMRIDLFEAAKDAKARANALSGEDERLAEKILLEGKRAGLDLSESDRKELESLKKELSGLCVQFQKNCNEEKGRIAFTPEELEGIPADVLSGYTKRDDGKLELTFKTPDVMPLVSRSQPAADDHDCIEWHDGRACRTASVDARRRRARLDACAPAVPCQYGLVDATGNDYERDTYQSLRMGGKKRAEAVPMVIDAARLRKTMLSPIRRVRDNSRARRRRKLRETYGAGSILRGEPALLRPIPPAVMGRGQGAARDQTVWRSGFSPPPPLAINRFAVWEAGATDASGFIGYTYLDLYPREGKYSHAAVWPLVPGFDLPDGKTRNYPVTAMVANLAKPTPDRPALMTHDNVVTFFHEMGHVFHGLLSTTKYSRFHGTSVSRDFVEAPSQMLENWCWVPKVLSKMSSHYKTKEPLSDELIDKIIKSRYVNIGMFMLRQLFFGKYDITVHTAKEGEDYTKLWARLREETSLVKGPARDAPGQGAFAHLTGDYDAGYYGYAYSLVFAADMYRAVFAADPLSAAAGRKYRDEILRPGGSRDEMDSLKAFLGRPPNSDAFLEQLLGSQKA
ncbi:zincin, partial [Auricularia subglabra TFB-10046 SS5]